MRTSCRLVSSVVVVAAMVVVRASADPAVPRDALAQGFERPPASAKPRVWWHWMNGNIGREGALLDLDWMARVGIGGVQVFEGNLGTPVITDHRVAYMSPEWQEVLRASAERARTLGMEMSIATAPGWSATGGPWVEPRDAMKKLVWSEITLKGGVAYRGPLPPPPDVAGPYQDVPVTRPPAERPAPYYSDARVLAFPLAHGSSQQTRVPDAAHAREGTVDAMVLGDGRYAQGVPLTVSTAARDAWVQYDYRVPYTVRSVIVGLPGARGFGTPPAPMARLEASADGRRFRTIAVLPPTLSPVRSASFAPVSARHFRLTLYPDTRDTFLASLATAPGALTLPPIPPAQRYELSEYRLLSTARVNAVEEKAGFATTPDYYALDTDSAEVDQAVKPGDVVDVTAHLSADGIFSWTPPSGGDWTVLRLGASLTGQLNGPVAAEATGLEVDKLDGVRVRRYLDHYLGLYGRALDPEHGTTELLHSILSDSIEAGPQNWTDHLPARFRQLRGYDPTPWLPALTGIVVGSAEQSDRFLWDFRRTIADLVSGDYYGQLASGATAHGLKSYSEALEDHRPQLGDDMQMRSHADIPMGAMWVYAAGSRPNPTYVADLQGAASVAHVYGRPLVAAESLTAFGWPWAFSPRDLKAVVDQEMALGVNRIAIHESTHQPLVDSKPGLALATFLGQYFNRNETWAELAGSWIDYLTRSAFLLQQGTYQADVAYFYGEEAPLTSLYGDAPLMDVPAGYAFDFIGADALLNELHADDGSLVSAGGTRYRLLYLGGSSRHMTLGTLGRIAELAAQGALIVGPRPISSPSLGDDPVRFARLTDELWGPPRRGAHTDGVGRGRVIDETDLGAALRNAGRAPDWRWSAPLKAGEIAVLHRKLDDGDLYFLSNRRSAPLHGTLDLRVEGRVPELWHADTGMIEPASYRLENHRTYVALDLEPDESVFIVLRVPAQVDHQVIPAASETVISTVLQPWRVSFEARRGAPESDTFATLRSWTESGDPGVRYYSGIGTYRTTVTLTPDVLPGTSIWLDLGDVRDVARVSINGAVAGTVWHPPYRVDVSKLVRAGSNVVEIAVANTWVNRLIGDAQPGAVPIAVTTAPAYRADAPLRPSGLLGPVRFLARR